MMCTGSNGGSLLFPEHLSIHSRTPKPVEIPAPTDKPDWNGLTAIAHTTYNGFALFDDGKLYAWGDSRYSGGAGNESICPTTGTVKCIDPRYGICATWEAVNQNFIYACKEPYTTLSDGKNTRLAETRRSRSAPTFTSPSGTPSLTTKASRTGETNLRPSSSRRLR